MNKHAVTKLDLEKAHKIYKEQEPRYLVYHAATALINLTIRNEVDDLSTGEALAVLLQSWNKAYYRFHQFNSQHILDIERILTEHQSELIRFRQRSIEDLCDADEQVVTKVFGTFEMVLGPVGAAKCLHLLAPAFFPLWDRAIAKAYGLALLVGVSNASRFWDLMKIARDQVKSLSKEQGIRNPLKAIDEYNYCKVKGWDLGP